MSSDKGRSPTPIKRGTSTVLLVESDSDDDVAGRPPAPRNLVPGASPVPRKAAKKASSRSSSGSASSSAAASSSRPVGSKEKKIEAAISRWSGAADSRIASAVAEWSGCATLGSARDDEQIQGAVESFLASKPARKNRGFALLQETLTRRRPETRRRGTIVGFNPLTPEGSTAPPPPLRSFSEPCVSIDPQTFAPPASSSSTPSSSSSSSSVSSSSSHAHSNDGVVVTVSEPQLLVGGGKRSSSKGPDYALVVSCLKADDLVHLKTLLHGRRLTHYPMIVPDCVVLGADKCLEWALRQKAEASTGVLFSTCAGIDPAKAANLPPTTLLPIELGIVFDRETAVRLLVKHTEASWFGADLYMRVYRMGKLQALTGLLLARAPRVLPSDTFVSQLAGEQTAFFAQLLRKGFARVYWKNSGRLNNVLYPLCRTGSATGRLVALVLKETHLTLTEPCCPGKPPMHLALSLTGYHVPARRRLSTVKALLKAGADVDQPCPDEQRTPLHYAAANSFLSLRRDAVDLLLQHGAAPFRPDRHGLYAHDYANPLVAAWLLTLRRPDPRFFGAVPTLRQLTLDSLRRVYVRLGDAEQGRFLVALADVGDAALWSFVKMPCPHFRWIDAVDGRALLYKKTALATLVARKLSIWDHDGSQLPACQQRLSRDGRGAALCRCTLTTFLRFRNDTMPGQLAVRLDTASGRLSLRYGAVERDLLEHADVRRRYLAALGLDPDEDALCLVLLCVCSLPAVFLHLGCASFVDLLDWCRRLAPGPLPVPDWLASAVAAADRQPDAPHFLPPVAKQDNGVLITDSETFELSEGAIHFEEPLLSESDEHSSSAASEEQSEYSTSSAD